MDFHLQHRDGRLLASGDMTIYHAASMKDSLLAAFAATADVMLDLENVTELDTCGLQMLLMLQRRARAEGRHVSIVAYSAAVREVLDLCWLQALCDLKREAA